MRRIPHSPHLMAAIPLLVDTARTCVASPNGAFKIAAVQLVGKNPILMRRVVSLQGGWSVTTRGGRVADISGRNKWRVKEWSLEGRWVARNREQRGVLKAPGSEKSRTQKHTATVGDPIPGWIIRREKGGEIMKFVSNNATECVNREKS